MTKYLIKPVLWNDQGYQRPSGASVASGYPADHGFGHEEWNNSDRLRFVENGVQMRVFHTEQLGTKPLGKDEDVILFLICSFRGSQFLVNVAGKATSLFHDENKRLSLANSLSIRDFWKDAWAQPSVRKRHRSAQEFQKFWTGEYKWLPTWTCPEEYYLSFNKPVMLKPSELSGRKRLVLMYGSYQEIDRSTALRIMEIAKLKGDSNIVQNLLNICDDALDSIGDINEINNNADLPETTKKVLIDARLGQGGFRGQLFRIWNKKCAVTGCTIDKMLIASHVKPWRSATTKERLDPHNGILLAVHLDALFDNGLITFDDNGKMLISKLINREYIEYFRLGGRLSARPNKKMKMYLQYHRSNIAVGVAN